MRVSGGLGSPQPEEVPLWTHVPGAFSFTEEHDA